MSRAHLTLLVEDLAALAAAAPAAGAPVLERCLARGRPIGRDVANADALRLALFGADVAAQVPVGALTAVADGLAQRGDERYWLRVEPVTLTADMTRVFMTAHGLADVEQADRAALRACVADALAEAGHALQHGPSDHWLLAPDTPPPVTFMPLAEALGRDMADTLPGAVAARAWRRLLTDLQVALHNADVNRRRRERGLREVNGVWLWGGGCLPPARPPGGFEIVISDHPVSRGLAVLADSPARSATADAVEAAVRQGGAILVDWRLGRAGGDAELGRLEALLTPLSRDVARGRLDIDLFDGRGAGWRLDRAALRRIWRRARPLREHFDAGPGART